MAPSDDPPKPLKEVHVLVTGFGEWPGYPKANPSYALTTQLPTHLTTPTHKIKITTHPTPIPVTYAAVDALIPALHATGADIILHTGVHAAAKAYALETTAWRTGYAARDAAGALPHERAGPRTVQLAANAADIAARWAARAPAPTRLSDNAGLFLCEYLFYGSAARARGGVPLVAFMHVPGGSEARDVARGRDVCVSLVQALVESRDGVPGRMARL